ncbi:MAG: DUF1848 family protein [Polyangia bacterium]|jgi:hypothetical protein|nr:DUF1848 family protein [Polyangia bacterium]
MKVRRPVILSASRRTDLPGWHAQALAERLVAAKERLGPGGCYGLVLWTRFPAALLRPPLAPFLEPGAFPAVVVNLTITGLGGGKLEPRAPAVNEAVAPLGELAERLGYPERLRWRFDPLLPQQDLLDRFSRLADVFARLGVPTCTISFPAERSLRGALGPRYRRFGVPEWPGSREDPSRSAEADILGSLWERASPRGLSLLVCSQPWALALCDGLRPAQCIPLDLLAKAHPPGALAPRSKDATQRKACLCPESEDLGDYRLDLCRTGCAYCYSTLGGPDPGETRPWFLRPGKPGGAPARGTHLPGR